RAGGGLGLGGKVRGGGRVGGPDGGASRTANHPLRGGPTSCWSAWIHAATSALPLTLIVADHESTVAVRLPDSVRFAVPVALPRAQMWCARTGPKVPM